MIEDPSLIFKQWIADARSCSSIPEPQAFCLATSNSEPNCRVLYMKEFDGNIKFFTSYLSRKSKEIESNARVSCCFNWTPLNRQVVIDGDATKMNENESDLYWMSRPYESKLSAMASKQSDWINSRQELIDACDAIRKQYPSSDDIPRPSFWGGYIVSPVKFEFCETRAMIPTRMIYHKDDIEGNGWSAKLNVY